MDLVGPAGVIPHRGHGQRQVDVARVGQRLAVVERFQSRQLVDLVFDQVAELVDQPAALAGIHPRPRTAVEGLAGGSHGRLHVSRVALGHARNRLFGGRVDRFEGASASRRHPLAANKALRLADPHLCLVVCWRGCGHPGFLFPERV